MCLINKGVDIMEKVYRSDIYQFFKDMPTNQQQEAINKIQQQIKKPPDHDTEKPESEVILNLEAIR